MSVLAYNLFCQILILSLSCRISDTIIIDLKMIKTSGYSLEMIRDRFIADLRSPDKPITHVRLQFDLHSIT